MTAPLLTARNLSRHYEVGRGPFRSPGVVKALNGATLELFPGKTLAVVGESGCGKSTLARVLTMIEPPTAGHLVLDGEDVAHADRATLRRLRRTVQIVFQDPYGSLNPRKKVGTILEEPLLINTDQNAATRRDAGGVGGGSRRSLSRRRS